MPQAFHKSCRHAECLPRKEGRKLNKRKLNRQREPTAQTVAPASGKSHLETCEERILREQRKQDKQATAEKLCRAKGFGHDQLIYILRQQRLCGSGSKGSCKRSVPYSNWRLRSACHMMDGGFKGGFRIARKSSKWACLERTSGRQTLGP